MAESTETARVELRTPTIDCPKPAASGHRFEGRDPEEAHETALRWTLDEAAAAAGLPASGDHALIAVEPPDPGSYALGETLTIFEAAVAYTGDTPEHPFLGPIDPLNRDHRFAAEKFFGLSDRGEVSTKDRTRTRRRNVYKELQRRVRTGEIWAVRDYLDGETLNPFSTRIKRADLLTLARERNDAAESIMAAAVAALEVETETVTAEAPSLPAGRDASIAADEGGDTLSGRRRRFAKAAFEKRFPDGLPLGWTRKQVAAAVQDELDSMRKADPSIPAMKGDTIERAAGLRK